MVRTLKSRVLLQSTNTKNNGYYGDNYSLCLCQKTFSGVPYIIYIIFLDKRMDIEFDYYVLFLFSCVTINKTCVRQKYWKDTSF